MGNVTIVTDRTFDEQVLAASDPVLVSFTATWCPASRNMAPVLRGFADRRDGLKVAKIDVGGIGPGLAANDNPLMQELFNVRLFPTLLLFKNGKVAGMLLGEANEKKLGAWVDETINAPEAQAIPVGQFRDYAESCYRQLQEAAEQQVRKNFGRALKIRRGLSLTSAFARAAGGFMLAAIEPGPLTAVLGATIMGPNALQAIRTLRDKDQMPQPLNISSRPLRMAFNLACLGGGVLLMSAGAAAPLLTFTGMAGLGLGLGIAWPALTNIGNDIGTMFTTDIEKYPVERPQKKPPEPPVS